MDFKGTVNVILNEFTMMNSLKKLPDQERKKCPSFCYWKLIIFFCGFSTTSDLGISCFRNNGEILRIPYLTVEDKKYQMTVNNQPSSQSIS